MASGEYVNAFVLFTYVLFQLVVSEVMPVTRKWFRLMTSHVKVGTNIFQYHCFLIMSTAWTLMVFTTSHMMYVFTRKCVRAICFCTYDFFQVVISEFTLFNQVSQYLMTIEVKFITTICSIQILISYIYQIYHKKSTSSILLWNRAKRNNSIQNLVWPIIKQFSHWVEQNPSDSRNSKVARGWSCCSSTRVSTPKHDYDSNLHEGSLQMVLALLFAQMTSNRTLLSSSSDTICCATKEKTSHMRHSNFMW